MGKKRRYITGLDGIRAIAVIMVLAYHLKLALFKSGFLGVTVFFVLSGYLITGILISEVEEEGTIDLKNFWLRRIRYLTLKRPEYRHHLRIVGHWRLRHNFI